MGASDGEEVESYLKGLPQGWPCHIAGGYAACLKGHHKGTRGGTEEGKNGAAMHFKWLALMWLSGVLFGLHSRPQQGMGHHHSGFCLHCVLTERQRFFSFSKESRISNATMHILTK